MTVLLFDFIGTTSDDVVTPALTFFVRVVWDGLLSQSWFYGFLILLGLGYIVLSVIGRSKDMQHARFG